MEWSPQRRDEPPTPESLETPFPLPRVRTWRETLSVSRSAGPHWTLTAGVSVRGLGSPPAEHEK